ncbi:MAG: hypothetical protein HQL51_15045, partial [Magnetococcales bacterium]|nr:hypothetical protein [Magnetococcales bacterium]
LNPASPAPLSGMRQGFRLLAERPELITLESPRAVTAEFRSGEAASPAQTLHQPHGLLHHRLLIPGETVSVVLHAAPPGELSGALALHRQPPDPMTEGMGERYVLPPGGARLFQFELSKPGLTGVGVNASRGTVEGRLYNAQGKALGEGVTQRHDLKPGTYYLLIWTAREGDAAEIRPVLLGTNPPTGVPDNVVQRFRALAVPPSGS